LEVLATQDIPPGTSCVVAGMYDDPALAQRLVQAAARCRIPVELRLSYVSDETLAMLLVSADAVVLPFRRTTSSSSVLMALGAGCPVIIPDLATLADVPQDCAWRYDGTLAGLAGAIQEAASTSTGRWSQMSAVALGYAHARSWAAVAQETKEVLQRTVTATSTNAPSQRAEPAR
jgi:beta-1,4-mannosyltransferase